MELAVDDACTLMALLHGRRAKTVRELLPGWDMVQVDLPSRTRLEAAASVLVGSGLAEVDGDWSIRLTGEGRALLRSLPRRLGMRQVPAAIEERLAVREIGRAPVDLPAAVFDPAAEAYLEQGRRRLARSASRSEKRWWRLGG